MQQEYRSTTGNSMANRNCIFIVLIYIIMYSGSCSEMNDAMQGITPRFIINKFFETWKKGDWKTLYTLAHPNIIQKIKMEKLSSEEQNMSDEELFIHQFDRASKINPHKVLKSYEVKSITTYKPGDTTVWVDAIVNGRKKRIPLTLDGLSLKVDLTRIE